MTETETIHRYVPWARAGVDVSKCTSAEEALKIAGLDFDVELDELRRASGLPLRQPRFAVVRKDTGASLGVVGTNYKLFQNREAFAFADSLLGDADFTHAGQYNDGAVAFVVAKMKEQHEVAGDKFDTYLFMRTSHDGSKAISVDVMPVRLVCTNGLAVNLKSAARRWAVSHVSDVKGRVAEARETLELTGEYMANFAEQAERLRKVRMTEIKLEKIVDEVWLHGGDKAKAEMKAGATALLQSSPTIHDEDRKNAWGVLNAVGEYLDHGRQWRSEKARIVGSVDHFAARFRNAVVAAAEASR